MIVQSTSAAGKSALQGRGACEVPGEERVSFSAMTGQSLFYMGGIRPRAQGPRGGLRRRARSAELRVEAAAERGRALDRLDREGRGNTGRLITHTYRVRGPVAIFLTTTAVDVDEELLNRCIVLSVDEDREQTRAIHQRQRERETLQGLVADRQRQAGPEGSSGMRSACRSVAVVNPFATRLGFSDARTRTRKRSREVFDVDPSRSLLLHQHQRERKTANVHGQPGVVSIEATLRGHPAREPIGAPRARPVAGRTPARHPPAPRSCWSSLSRRPPASRASPASGSPFTRRELREQLRLGRHPAPKSTWLASCRLELVNATAARTASSSTNSAWDRDQGSRRHACSPGVIDPDQPAQPAAEHAYDLDRSGSEDDRSGGWSPPGRCLVGGRSAHLTARIPATTGHPSPSTSTTPQIAVPGAFLS